MLTLAQVRDRTRLCQWAENPGWPLGESVYAVEQRDAPGWLVQSGSIDVVRRNGLNHAAHVTSDGTGQFSGEVNQLSGNPSIASGRTGPEGCLAVPFDPPDLRALMITSADIGEIVMRALILQRVTLIGQGGAGIILIGGPNSPEILRRPRDGELASGLGMAPPSGAFL